MIIDLDAAPDRQSGVAGEGDRGANADRHDDEARGDQRPVLELYPFDLAVTDDSIANGTWRPAPGQPRPLALFTAQRVEAMLGVHHGDPIARVERA